MLKQNVTKKIVFSTGALLIISLLISGCTERPVEKVQKTLCPYECCESMAKYDDKICTSKKICVNNKCAEENTVAVEKPKGDEVEIPSELNLKVGETARTPEVEVTIKSAEFSDYFCYSSHKCSDIPPPTEGAKFLYAIVEVRNAGLDRMQISPTDFSATDSEGNRIDVDTYAPMNTRDDALESLTELFKNQRIEGSVQFQIPKNSTGIKIIYDFGDTFTGTKLAIWKI